MQQAMPLESQSDGTVMRSIAVFTDITHLQRFGKSFLSMIGKDGEPSYYNIESTTEYKLERLVLTRREREILFFIARGRNTREIARDLAISEATVANHRKNMLRKTRCRTSAEVIAKAYEQGWI
jgi:DNA-binding CsgD family transcriptional regulator